MNNDFKNDDIRDLIIERDGYLEQVKDLEQELQRKDNEIKQLQEDIVNHIKIASEYKEQMIIKDNIINELKESINNFDVFKEFTFPLMKRDEEQQVISSIDYEWRKSVKEPFLNKIEELENGNK